MFRVAWSINPHMHVGSVQPFQAIKQHLELVHALETAGAHVDVLPFVHGAFDSVFSKDNAVIIERADGKLDALLAHPKHLERRTEQRARAAAFTALGIEVNGTCRTPLEGGDLVMLPGARGSFLGHGFRSSLDAVRALQTFLDADVTVIELRDPRLYHLDMALSVLDDGTALVCPEAMTASSLRAVEDHPAITSTVRIPLHEALAFGVNFVQVGKEIIFGAAAESTVRALRATGHRIRRISLDQFHRAGGGAACLVSRVHHQHARGEGSSDVM